MIKMIAPIITLVFILITASPFIGSSSDTVYAGDNKHEEYIVEKADSLWGISGKILSDPFLWPMVWNINPHINNPNLIYPGTTIFIPTREELAASQDSASGRMPLSILKKRRLKAIPKLVFEFPEDEFNKYIVNKKDFVKSGWISPEFPGIGKIISSQKGSLLIDTSDIIYIETDGDSEPGSTYFTIKSVKKVKHPVTKKKMGQQIAISGTLVIIGSDNNVLKARLLTTFDDISVGDGLLPFTEMEPPLNIDEPRRPDISGHIIESRINSTISARGDIVFLDKGSNDGVEVGDLFNVIIDKPVRRPIGKIQIISRQPATSTAVITSGDQEISLGSIWGQE